MHEPINQTINPSAVSAESEASSLSAISKSVSMDSGGSGGSISSNQNSIHQLANSSGQAKQLQQTQELANKSEKSQEAQQIHKLVNESTGADDNVNNTGLPNQLKAGLEQLSGISLDDVKVHYNSAKPAQLQAHAFAEGNDIYVASGQEKHLAHEAWHVIQQKQGRVKATTQMNGNVNVNDDEGLEKEADAMGAKALNISIDGNQDIKSKSSNSDAIQLKRLRSDLRMGSGNAGQWHNGDPDFHVTVFPDHADHSVKRGFPFISDLWVSEFHTTRKSDNSRRFFDIDRMDVKFQYGNQQGHQELAVLFRDDVLQGVKEYSEQEAQQYQANVDLQASAQNDARISKIEEVVLKHANALKEEIIDWNKASSGKYVGRVRNELVDNKVVLESNEIQDLQVKLIDAINQVKAAMQPEVGEQNADEHLVIAELATDSNADEHEVEELLENNRQPLEVKEPLQDGSQEEPLGQNVVETVSTPQTPAKTKSKSQKKNRKKNNKKNKKKSKALTKTDLQMHKNTASNLGAKTAVGIAMVATIVGIVTYALL